MRILNRGIGLAVALAALSFGTEAHALLALLQYNPTTKHHNHV
jgi:hypothetical protein